MSALKLQSLSWTKLNEQAPPPLPSPKKSSMRPREGKMGYFHINDSGEESDLIVFRPCCRRRNRHRIQLLER